MKSHSELSDIEFEREFASGSLIPALFTHEAHLRLAWIHIDKYGIERAISNVRTQLIEFVEMHGEKDKYNETVTVAALRAVFHFKLKSQSINFQDFIVEFPRLVSNFKELLGSHYTTDIFVSEMAKRQYIEPELLPFD